MDKTNSIKWNTLHKKEYRQVRDYYRGLISFRKAHSALRRKTAQDVLENILAVDGLPANVTAFHIRGGCPGEPAKSIFAIFNPNRKAMLVPLPQGNWDVCIEDMTAGTKSLRTVQGRAEVSSISAMVLTQG